MVLFSKVPDKFNVPRLFTAPSKFWAELVNVPSALLTISVAVILPEPVFVNFPSLVKVVD